MELNQQARKAALERLERFVGDWSIETSFSTEVKGSSSFEWTLDGQFLVQRSSVPVPEAPDSVSIVGVDQSGEVYTQHYFDSRGVARLYAMTLDGDAWQLLRNEPDFFPLDFSQRYVGRFTADGDTIEGRWETSRDGGDWELDFGLSYRRVR